MTALSVRGIRKTFGSVQALRGVDLDVPAGSLTAVLGPSGCGKTTLLRLIAGFELPDAGTISLHGRNVAGAGSDVPARHRHVGYVPQEGALFPHLDVAANIAFGLPRSERRTGRRIDELLDLVGLDLSMRHRAPHQLSGGQQQRIALARALAPRPALVLLDEPFASLDASLREETGRSVARTLHQVGATALLITHDQNEALSLGHRVAVMWEGRVLQVDRPETLYRSPATPEVAGFVGAAVILPAVVDDRMASCALGSIPVEPSPLGAPSHVVVRPEQLSLGPPSGPVTGQVTEVRYYGHDAIARLRLAGGEHVLARLQGSELPAVGSQVGITVRGTARAFSAADVALATP